MSLGSAPYTEIAGFEHVYLEDGWVLAFESRAKEVRFFVEAVLTPRHPLYAPPRSGEQHSYARFAITFVDASSITWAEVRAWPSVDVGGEVDFGNIDAFSCHGTTFCLAGEWGRVEITARKPPTIEVLPQDTPSLEGGEPALVLPNCYPTPCPERPRCPRRRTSFGSAEPFCPARSRSGQLATGGSLIASGAFRSG